MFIWASMYSHIQGHNLETTYQTRSVEQQIRLTTQSEDRAELCQDMASFRHDGGMWAPEGGIEVDLVSRAAGFIPGDPKTYCFRASTL